MKKFNLLILGLVAMFGFMFSAKAAETAILECKNPEIKIGESTVCTVTIGYDSAINTAAVTLDTSKYLQVSNVIASAAGGWQADSANTSAATGKYTFVNTLTSGATGASEVFSFTATLLDEAKNLSANDECANLCLSAVSVTTSGSTTPIPFSNIKKDVQGVCYEPTIIEENCPDCDPKNPETGAFMNYLIIVGVGIAAIAVILIVRKTTKFYRV